MIATTPYDAESAMNKQILAYATNGQALALIGYNPVILWEGVETVKPDTKRYFMRVSHQNVFTSQANLSNCEGLAGQKRYRSSGLSFVQIFGPLADKEVARKCKELARIMRNAFRANLIQLGEDIVWFRNARINPIPNEQDIYRLNVVAEHEYDELG